MKVRSLALPFVSILIGLFVLTGCPPKKKLAIDEKPKEEAMDEVNVDTTTVKSTSPTDIQINQDWTEIPNLQIVQFGYDSAQLDDSARVTLKNNVAILKKLPKSITIRVEGHCDDRGTVEYNIALGQRRATAVKSYYGTAGIGRSRLDTISFGEERPVCNEENDACWARNRRGTTKVKNAQTITVNTSDLQ